MNRYSIFKVRMSVYLHNRLEHYIFRRILSKKEAKSDRFTSKIPLKKQYYWRQSVFDVPSINSAHTLVTSVSVVIFMAWDLFPYLTLSLEIIKLCRQIMGDYKGFGILWSWFSLKNIKTLVLFFLELWLFLNMCFDRRKQ